MTYHHKHKSCAQDTKNIVENIFSSSSDEYKLAKTSEASRFLQSKTGGKGKTKENVLPGEASFDLEKEEPIKNEAGSESQMEEEEDLERYLPKHHVKFEAADAQEASERKKKRRNYMEFRKDYRKKKEESE